MKGAVIGAAALRGILAGAAWAMGLYISIVLSWLLDNGMELIMAPIIFALLVGVLLSGRNWGWAWLFSIPAALLLWYGGVAGKLEWALNQIYPGYGRLSAGGGFGVMIVMICYSFWNVFIAPLTAWFLSDWRAERRVGRKAAR